MANIPGSAWLDADGKHVWFEHQCVNGERKRSMLPWSNWRALDGKVTPSIVCTVPGCDFHDTPAIGTPPFNFGGRGDMLK